MKHLLGLFIITLIAFTSCEGRKTQSQALSESIEEFKKTVNFESNVYIPENYTEREVDTVMSNGFRVKIKIYSDMSSDVLFSKIKDTINYQTHYRNFKFDIRVEKEGELIYEESFDKHKANQLFGYHNNYSPDSPFHDFDKLAILQSIQVDDEPSLKNTVLIDVMFAIPETNRSALHTLFVNDNGTINMVHVTQN
ncbi:hypothetical protein KO504_03850 [Winogradskyella psychrotolerans]|uniref:hypothetical protein n=1 Tax=Winogradskyella psychrotolerans TaxID=1344585 RepID=UPI001C06A4AD|nr:hypothetical protein [Winogradskyella psychrotolerans]MBU2920462.1 hypothetical protein [Winogradskyella psychrotolerans]